MDAWEWISKHKEICTEIVNIVCWWCMVIWWVFHVHMVGVSWSYGGCFMVIWWVFHGHMVGVSCSYGGCFMVIWWVFHDHMVGVSWSYGGCFMVIWWVFIKFKTHEYISHLNDWEINVEVLPHTELISPPLLQQMKWWCFTPPLCTLLRLNWASRRRG